MPLFALDPPASTLRPVAARLAAAILSALLLVWASPGAAIAATPPLSMAVLDFDYIDTSGEVQDQTSAHQAQLQAMMQSIRGNLVQDGKYRLVPIVCGADPCSMQRSVPADLMDATRRAGARLLLFGGIHKMSTLVQWAKVQVVDVESDKLVFDRVYTFRGDSAEAWRRATEYMVKELAARDFTQ
jgi:hypothetical protein